MSSTCIFVIYSVVKFNKPLVNPEVILPSLLSAITGPLSSMVPGCVASAWSIFYFKEIEPGRNLHLLYAGMAVT
uniref:Uncharacterized protein n=1 Tax=Ditylenchus dipsaci TaxID=166011 RepID=A0A915DTK2_9BILA